MKKLCIFTLCLSLLSCSQAMLHGIAAGLAEQRRSATPAAIDAEPERYCVHYETKSGWSKGYSVNAYVLSGSELNDKTSSYRYNVLSTYVVIFWDAGQASIIELDYYFGSIPTIGDAKGKDHEGRKWKVSKSSLCF